MHTAKLQPKLACFLPTIRRSQLHIIIVDTFKPPSPSSFSTMSSVSEETAVKTVTVVNPETIAPESIGLGKNGLTSIGDPLANKFLYRLT